MTQPNEQLIEKVNSYLARISHPDKWEKVLERFNATDACFITDAPEIIRALLDENKRLNEVIADRTNDIKFYDGELEQVKAERDEDKKFIEAAAVGVVKLKNEIESLRSVLSAKYKVLDFSKDVLRVAFAGGSLDGGDIQGMGVKYGLLREEGYDPDKHEENRDFEPGDPYFVFTSILTKCDLA